MTGTRSDPRGRALGSLLGLAIGDCLGAALEGKPPPSVPVRDLIYDPTIWTDDTQQALVLAESTVRHGRPDPVWVADRFLEMKEAGVHRGTGSGFRSAVTRFSETGDWRTSGRTDRVGNGAAMRIAPTAVACAATDPEEFWKQVVAVSLTTHRELCSIAGALAVAWTAARLSRSDSYPLRAEEGIECLRELADWLGTREAWLAEELPAKWGGPVSAHHGGPHAFSAALRDLAERNPATLKAALDRIAHNASQTLGKQVYAGNGFVLASVVTAVYVALTSQAGFEETLVTAVNLGGDVDTIGAMVGGMVGAATDPEDIPEPWLRFPGADGVRMWGEALAGERSVESLPDLLRLEQHLSALR